MTTFSFVLVLCFAVLASAVVHQVVSRVSMPLVQIGLGAAIALLGGVSMYHFQADSELFLVLFIAPLLFQEARGVDKVALWSNRRPVASLAIGLVVAVALIVGFFAHAIEPSIPLAAAFALGAEGVQLGTRFICCTECTVHPNFKQAVLDARDRSTSVTGQRTGHPVRCLRNKLTAEFDKLDARLAPLEEIEKLGTGRLRSAVVDGDTDWGSLMSGQSAAMVNDILPARRIVERLFGEARDVLQKIQGCCDVEPE